MSTATVIGFGGRTPPSVLDLLSKAVNEKHIVTIKPQRSQNLECELLRPPYRTFLSNSRNDEIESKQPKANSFILYCLPTSVSEYVRFQDESSYIRSKLLRQDDDDTLVVIYDTTGNSFVGGTSDDILSYLSTTTTTPSSPKIRRSFAHAALTSLIQLDTQTTTSSFLSPPSTTSEDGDGGDTVVVVGSGGREHALAVSLSHSPLVSHIICCPGNGGTAIEGGKISNATGVNGKQDNDTVVSLVKRLGNNVKMVVVGPEQPLVDGIVDVLKVECPDVMVFGPSKEASILESSKAFTKDFLQEHSIPTAKYRNFTDPNLAIEYVKSLSPTDRQVVKASGLAAGKGVLLPTTQTETINAVNEIMSDKAFGSAGDTCVIESFMTGPEASCLALCDGKTAVLLPAAQDHKRALDGDEGLNTGGMGAYAPAPCVTDVMQKEIERMCVKTVEKMKERGTPYVGVLYAGMMLTPNGPSVLEFNCRFGDPETQVVLPLLETDLYELFKACCNGTLDTMDVRFKEHTHAATVVCAAKGYPLKYPKGMRIDGMVEADGLDGVKVYHAGTKLDDTAGEGSGVVTRCSGGRVLAVTGIGPTLQDALQSSYDGVNKITFKHDDQDENLLHHRTDIGQRAVHKKLRLGVLGSTRGTALIPVMEACASNSINAEIVCVLSNRSQAPILEKGKSLGTTVTTKFISAKGLSRKQYDAECTSILQGCGVEYVMLVGYMRILSKEFTDYWYGRCINVHPSLLPKHAGGMDLAVHQAVIDSGDKETGCTIHQVTEDVDGGPIVVQKIVKVEPNETPESLKTKVQAQEGPAFIEAIQKYISSTTTSSGDGVISYADAGVNIDAGNTLVNKIKPLCKSTLRPGCENSDLGGFGGLFDLSAAGFNDNSNTILIGATDGVGTKLRIAQSMKNHAYVGIDLVAMCVNDLIVAGGEPLFFLDYYATGKLHVEEATQVVSGIAEGCRQAHCGLIGGETAEMPSMYKVGEYDLAGFSVGAVERDGILPKNVGVGDVILGLESSGIHSNGFSLVRKLLEKEKLGYDSPCPWEENGGVTVGESLLTPTKIYVKACLPLIKRKLLNGLAHITGGGLLENLPRSLPKGVIAEITNHPKLPNVFQWMQEVSGLDDTEMLRTFNCGIGMVLIVRKDRVKEVKDLLVVNGETNVYELGVLIGGEEGEQVVMKSSLS